MNYYLLFAPRFLEWPLAICRELAALDPDATFSGIITGEPGVRERIRQEGIIADELLDYHDELEQKWITAPYDQDRLKVLEKRLGADAINRIIIADRHIGNGYVTGGLFPTTDLVQYCGDTDRVRACVTGLIEYYLNRLETLRPDVVFCYTVAGAQAMALAEICKLLDIPFRRLMHTRIGSRMVLDDTIEGLTGPVTTRYHQAVTGDTQELDNHLPEANEYLKQLRARSTRPDYVESARQDFLASQSYPRILREILAACVQLARSLLRPEYRTLRQISPINRLIFRVPRLLRARKQTRSGKPFLPDNYSPSGDYVYYPLHVEPEASTMVVAPDHTNQLAVIEAIAKHIPPSMTLVVKEHFPMLGGRPNGYYEQIAAMPKVELASAFASPLDLVNNARLITCISGTAGLEAIMMQKPLLVFGAAPYLGIDAGYVSCPDLSQISAAIPQALKLEPVPDKKLLMYLCALMDVSFDFPTDLMWGAATKQTTLDHPEAPKFIAKGLFQLCLNRNEQTI